jgi:hypothetical protein
VPPDLDMQPPGPGASRRRLATAIAAAALALAVACFAALSWDVSSGHGVELEQRAMSLTQREELALILRRKEDEEIRAAEARIMARMTQKLPMAAAAHQNLPMAAAAHRHQQQLPHWLPTPHRLERMFQQYAIEERALAKHVRAVQHKIDSISNPALSKFHHQLSALEKKTSVHEPVQRPAIAVQRAEAPEVGDRKIPAPPLQQQRPASGSEDAQTRELEHVKIAISDVSALEQEKTVLARDNSRLQAQVHADMVDNSQLQAEVYREQDSAKKVSMLEQEKNVLVRDNSRLQAQVHADMVDNSQLQAEVYREQDSAKKASMLEQEKNVLVREVHSDIVDNSRLQAEVLKEQDATREWGALEEQKASLERQVHADVVDNSRLQAEVLSEEKTMASLKAAVAKDAWLKIALAKKNEMLGAQEAQLKQLKQQLREADAVAADAKKDDAKAAALAHLAHKAQSSHAKAQEVSHVKAKEEFKSIAAEQKVVAKDVHRVEREIQNGAKNNGYETSTGYLEAGVTKTHDAEDNAALVDDANKDASSTFALSSEKSKLKAAMESIEASQDKALQHIQHKLAALDDMDDDNHNSQAQVQLVDQDVHNVDRAAVKHVHTVVKAAVKETPGDGEDRDAQARNSQKTKNSESWHGQGFFPVVFFYCLSPYYVVLMTCYCYGKKKLSHFLCDKFFSFFLIVFPTIMWC